MKKVFVEPEMQIIELNLHENIAASTQGIAGYYFNIQMFGGCTVQNTEYSIFELESHMGEATVIACAFYNSRRRAQFYSMDEIISKFK